MIKVLIDSTFLKKEPDGAISIHLYIGRLLSGLSHSRKLYPILATWKGMVKYWDDLVGVDVEKIIVNETDTVSHIKKVDRILGLVPFEKELKERGVQVVITPCFSAYGYIYPRKYNQHMIIHDVFTFRNPQNKTLSFRLNNKLMTGIVSLRIPYFISISQNTREDVLAFLHRNSDVVYNSIPFDFNKEEVPVPEVKDKRFILDVNRLEKYKNPQLLVKALSLIKTKIPHNLYFKGLKSNVEDYSWLENLVKELGMEDRVIIDFKYRSEAEMRWLYTHADLYVTPSFDEGFGYTPIEAAVLKTPVLISDIPTLREVTQGKLESFNPHSPEELAEKMLNIISAPPSDETLESIATFYLKEYSLERQIERLTEVIMHNIGLEEKN